MTIDTNSLDGDLSLSDTDLEAMGNQHQSRRNHHNYRYNNNNQNHKSSSTSFRYEPDEIMTEHDIIDKKETRNVYYIKGMVIGILTIITMIGSGIIYLNVKNNESNLFQVQYNDNAQRIITTFHNNLQRRKDVLENLSIHITSYVVATSSSISISSASQQEQSQLKATTDAAALVAKEVGEKGGRNDTNPTTIETTNFNYWPYVTIPDFDLRSHSSKQLGGGILLGMSFIPIVQTSQRDIYEEYTSSKIFPDTTTTTIDHPDHPQGPYFPIRQLTPDLPQFINWNTVAEAVEEDDEDDETSSHNVVFGEGILETYHSKQVVLSKILNNGYYNDNKTTTVMDQWLLELSSQQQQQNGQSNTNNYITEQEPISSLYFPILMEQPVLVEEVDDSSNNNIGGMAESSSSSSSSKMVVVGMLTDFMTWSSLLSNILSPDRNGYIVVLENSCSQSYTFQINGPIVQLLVDNGNDKDGNGVHGDFHDPTYDSMKFSYHFNLKDDEDDDDDDESSSTSSSSFSSPDWNREYCPYTLHIYPSIELEESYTSNLPILYTLAAVLVYFFATFVFLIYDCVVERRQQRVVQVALESRAIVSSLFPAVVRDRLFEQQRKVSGRVRSMLQAATMGGSGRGGGTNDSSTRSNNDGGDNSRTSGNGGSGFRPSILSKKGRATGANGGGPRTTGGSVLHQVSFRLGRKNSELELEGGDLTNYDESTRRGEDDPTTMYSPNNNNANAKSNGNEDRDGRPPLRPSFNMNQSTARLKSYLSESSRFDESSSEIRPIADLFPHTTVLFADICGFTSWSSQREPEKVFTLLQAIFKAFDKAAQKRSVFKVETIGDCYVAVTGLPDPQENHAWRMCKFALECRSKMMDVTRDLEVKLGPDTGDLTMRFGMHSGPVTAGVLRGEKSRFQLFGDTVNTASRMESTGQRNRIQLSQSTADRLNATGKGGWLRPREDMVEAKGKGVIKTFWLASRPQSGSSKSNRRSSLDHILSDKNNEILSRRSSFQNDMLNMSLSSFSGNSGHTENEETFGAQANMSTQFDIRSEALSEDRNRRRVINWQSELLIKSLKLIVAHRVQTNDEVDIADLSISGMKGSIVLDEVVESIALPKFDEERFHARRDPQSIQLSMSVVSQLHDYVSTIAGLYSESAAFHNFEHASHVAMSASKLLHRFIDPECEDAKMAEELHDITDGINSDPLTQFAVVFAALIHDVDHTGVPNEQLIKEEPQMGEMYRHRSVAEQKSVDIAWDLLMDSAYDDLRACIYSNQSELSRFRQLVVNCVMATDLFDEEKKISRDKRWAKHFPDVFSEGSPTPPSASTRKSLLNPRATLMIEHILQASDISHTMQHWHVFRKWNECLFFERCDAFEDGRSETNPAETWYESELLFFDNYVIPLARKLHACEAFGVASSEGLSYSLGNRDEWAGKGRTVVTEMVEKYQMKKEQEQVGKDQK